MIYFFYLLSFILVLILSEITAKKEKIKMKHKKSCEPFSDYIPTVNLGIRSVSLSNTEKKISNKKVIDPFKQCINYKSDFNWTSYFDGSKYKQLAVNQVYF